MMQDKPYCRHSVALPRQDIYDEPEVIMIQAIVPAYPMMISGYFIE